MNVLIVGNGGREHAIARKIHQDDPDVSLFCAPGNAGTAEIATNVAIDADAVEALTHWAAQNRPDLTVVGPEVPLCLGLVDALQKQGLRVFGPTADAAQMEGSKQFAKAIMNAAQVPTAQSRIVRSEKEARDALDTFGIPIVFKADGLAAGKGVFVCMTADEVDQALQQLFVTPTLGRAAQDVLVEAYIEGEEASILAFVDGETIVPLAASQDHKRLLNDDEGPNTGGMGAYCPAPCVTPDMMAVVVAQVFKPVVAELKARGIVYKGILYAGLMLTPNGPKVLEFNCRFGDPETQCVLPRMESPLIEAMQACIDGTLGELSIRWREDACVCVVMVAGGYPGKYEKGTPIDGLDEASRIEGVHVCHAGTKRMNDAVVTAGGRVLGVTALGPTLGAAVSRAYQAVLKVKFNGAEYRTDIAHRALKQ